MKLFVQRHGFADPPSEKQLRKTNWKWSPEDLARELTKEGRDNTERVAEWMKKNDWIPSRIEHSPAKRTMQTAKIVGRVLGVSVSENVNLLPGKPVEMVIKSYADDENTKRVMIVGHSDNIPPALRALNWLSGADSFAVDPIATSELRIVDLDRDSYTWDEIDRVLPSWVGGEDLY